MKNVKYVFLILFTLVLLGLAFYGGYKYSWQNKKQETSTSVVVEKIEKVFKLVAVEGHISVIHDFKEYHQWELPFFRKKALVRVNAKVLAGFDFEKLKITVDDQSKTIFIDEFPEAEILSMEHDLDYYDISQSTFNKFSAEDYNRINKEAKEHVRKKAIDTQILNSAEAQKEEILSMFETIIEATGWNVVIKNESNVFNN